MPSIGRRDFLRGAGGALACGPLAFGQARVVSLVVDPSDPVASSAPAQWAAKELEQSLEAAGYTVHRREHVRQSGAHECCIVASGDNAVDASAPKEPESLTLLETRIGGRQALIAHGSDPRGLVYALLELKDRVSHREALQTSKPILERAANPVRSVMRQFTSEALDKPWFYDREMWTNYLTMLATQRFNRLHLGFGLGYDFLQNVTDSYFLFLYPFLVSVPGYDVRATNLPDAERDRNLDTLRFISDQTVARGMEFQLGIWMHGYTLANSPRARYIIEGLTPETHGAYCRDALTRVLNACPAISAVALRIHGESGVAEGSYGFWETIFDGVKRCGRKVEIDLHSKGINTTMIDTALRTGLPVNVSPKYWAEHLGMPYHQASIRELERPVEGHQDRGLMALSEGSRIFTRYGYADLLRDDRKYTVRHRVFSGTQRLLLWGDPTSAAAYSRAFQFCGSMGADLMEPLTCRGRRGSGIAGGRRTGYIDAHLEPPWDWEKYEYWYRVWGRKMYNPDGEMIPHPAGDALASASRILPIVTTAHLPSAACDGYWPEIYWNQPMAAEAPRNPYGDSPSPKTFQNASPLDPQLFSRMSDFAGELLTRERSAKYSPIEVAQWLEDFADEAEKHVRRAEKLDSVELSRVAIDVDLQIYLGRFFAAKFRSGVLYSIYERTGDRRALEEALKAYRRARAMWAQLSDRSSGVYAADLSASDKFSERGQWLDRIPALDQDIAQMEQRLATATTADEPRVGEAIAEALGRPKRESIECRHVPPAGFRAGESVSLEMSLAQNHTATLYYRHVNQAERFQSMDMAAESGTHRATIPAAYADSPFPLQYYFELREGSRKAWLYPGFAPDLTNQPYFVLRRVT